MKNQPKKIFLQIGHYNENEDFEELGEVTWASEPIHNNDLSYISLSHLRSKLKEIARLAYPDYDDDQLERKVEDIEGTIMINELLKP